MRNFALANSVSSAATPDLVEVNELAIYHNVNGVATRWASGELKGEANLVVGQPNGLNLILPIYKQDMSLTVMEAQEGTKFVATVTAPAPTHIGTYSLLLVKKGKKFNERNTWTTSIYLRDTSFTAEKLAEIMTKMINNNTVGHNLVAENAGAVITITAQTAEDFEIIPADAFIDATVEVTTPYTPARLDYAHLRDLYEKAMANRGFEYTKVEACEQLITTFDEYVNGNNGLSDFTMDKLVTIKFSEPRKSVTHDQVVNQTIQIACTNEVASYLEDLVVAARLA